MSPIHLFNYRVFLILIVFGIASSGHPAFANEEQWFISAHSGVSQLNDTNGQTEAVGLVDGRAAIDLDSGFLAGMALGYRYGPRWAVELAWEYRSNDSETTLADGTTFSDGNYASNIFFINGRYHFLSRDKWAPYIGAGVGWIQEIDLDLEDMGNEISYAGDGNIGIQGFAGVSYLINTDWAISGELRYSDFGEVDLEGEAGASGNIQSLEYSPLTFQFGVSYQF